MTPSAHVFFLIPMCIKKASASLHPKRKMTGKAKYERGKMKDSKTWIAPPISNHVETEKWSLNIYLSTMNQRLFEFEPTR